MHYNIVIVSDEGYIQHAAVMLLSLFDHNKGKDFHVYLLTNGITVSTESRLREICYVPMLHSLSLIQKKFLAIVLELISRSFL